MQLWVMVFCFLGPVMGGKEHSLQAWYIEGVRNTDCVYLAYIVLDLKFESAHTLYGNARANASDFVSPLNHLQVTIKLIRVVCHAEGCVAVHTNKIGVGVKVDGGGMQCHLGSTGLVNM